MMQLAFASRFFDDMDSVRLESKQDEIMDAVALLPTIPEMGSRRVPDSILDEFGDNVRKLVVSPFLVVYEIMEQESFIFVHGLIHERQAR